jgi:DnaK suppressor protein
MRHGCYHDSKDKLMTEAEILAMPEDDYMNPAQMEFFRLRFSLMRDELLENAASTGANLRENELVADPADRATVEEEHALELRVRDRERKLIKKIEEALGRIAEGEYGWCEETGDPIGIGRLLARPTATLSIDAQERRERTQKLYGE